MILYLIRHGETTHNRDGLGLGREDLPLTERGLMQAKAVAGYFARKPLQRVYASPLQRALTVAGAVAAACAIPVEARHELIEMDVGETEGLSFGEMRERYPDFLRHWASSECASARMPSGESLDDVDTRIAPFVAELLASSAEAVAVVSHNFVIKLLMCRLLGLAPVSFRAFTVDVASVSTFQLRSGRTAALTLNDTCHLEGLNLDY